MGVQSTSERKRTANRSARRAGKRQIRQELANGTGDNLAPYEVDPEAYSKDDAEMRADTLLPHRVTIMQRR